jgi:DNA-binding NarL/FixJ family response regulator
MPTNKKMTPEKVKAIVADVKAGMKCIPLQIRHQVSQPTMYGNPAVRAVLLGRLKRQREAQLRAIVACARRKMLHKEIADRFGISKVTVTKYLNKAVKQGLMTLEERQELKHMNMSDTLRHMWAQRKEVK